MRCFMLSLASSSHQVLRQRERVLALIKSRALFEVSTILELALWKNKMQEPDDSNPGSRGECRVMCGADDIIPCVLSYL